MTLPGTAAIEVRDTHRLIPSQYRDDRASVLVRIADPDDPAHLDQIFDLDHATNDRLLAEHDLLPGIGARELIWGVPHYRVVNAAFTHARPEGSRFNGPDRGAWYAGFALDTALAEIVFHKTVALSEIGIFEDEVTYDDYLADFAGDFHDLRGAPAFAPCLDPDSYLASQKLAEALLEAGALGLVYPSVRHPGGTCLACFRPAAVGNVRRGATHRLVWSGTPEPEVARETA